MAKQSSQGYWETPDHFYTAKYKATVWQIIILAELGADGAMKESGTDANSFQTALKIAKAAAFLFGIVKGGEEDPV